MTSRVCKRAGRADQNERGQALLELTLVVFIMVVLTFCVIDFGYAIWQVQVISRLTREGSNLASRNTSLKDSANAVVNDGSALNLASKGEVIITAVQNQGTSRNPKFVMTNQYVTGSLAVASKIGTYNPKSGSNVAALPATTPTIPLPDETIYVTEIYSPYSPITSIGKVMKLTMPSTLYDVAYF